MINPSSTEVLQLINNKATTYNDRELSSEEINPRAQGEDLSFILQENQVLPLTSSAMSQFLNRLNVPIIFYKRCSLDLQQSILNEFNQKKRNFLIRGIQQEGGELCRAVLSNHFSKDKDDIHIFPPALEALEEREMNASLQQFNYDEDYSHLLANFDDCEIVQGDYRLTASLSLLNSETGHSSVWIYPTVTINGYQYANRRGDVSNNIHRIIHRGQLKPNEFQQVIRDTKNIAQVGIVQYLRAREEVVTAEHAVDFVETIDEFPKRFARILQNDWQTQQNIQKTVVMEQILRLSAELPLFQKLSVSRQVGRFIRLFENTERERAEVIEQLGN